MFSTSTFARKLLLATGIVATLPMAAGAQVAWTDWSSTGEFSGIPTVTGSLLVGGSTVDVTFYGPRAFVQTGCPSDYWTPTSTYTGPGVPNAPTNCEMIALSAGGTKIVSFSSAVVDPVLALVSWNLSGGVPFSGRDASGALFFPSIEVVKNGGGTYGAGSMAVASNVFTPSGEVHGVIRLKGTFSSFAFADVDESWHGITVGATGLAAAAPSTVPEPATVALTATGLLALVGVARRRRG